LASTTPFLNDAQRRFLRLRMGLTIFRYATVAGLLTALIVFGVIHL
jgi:hypothetical protein